MIALWHAEQTPHLPGMMYNLPRSPSPAPHRPRICHPCTNLASLDLWKQTMCTVTSTKPPLAGSSLRQRVKHDLQSTHTLASVLPSRRHPHCSDTLRLHAERTGLRPSFALFPLTRLCLPGWDPRRGESREAGVNLSAPVSSVPALGCPISGTLTLRCPTQETAL